MSVSNSSWSILNGILLTRASLVSRSSIHALEHLVAQNPGVTFIGAHVGCNAEDLAFGVCRMFDIYPNFYADIAARVADLGRQPRATRRLIMKHPTCGPFGTDAFPPKHGAYAGYFLRFLETDDEYFPYSHSARPGAGVGRSRGYTCPKKCSSMFTQVMLAGSSRAYASTDQRRARELRSRDYMV